MSSEATRRLRPDEVPVIDIGSLVDGSDVPGVGRSLVWAATEVGFIYVSNHGVPDLVIETARRAGLEFFHLADERKLEVSSNIHHHGYLRPGSTKMYDDAKLDLKESFNWGIELDSIELERERDNPLIGPNRWPSALPSFKDSVYPFFEAASRCAVQLLQGFALGASLDVEFFVSRRDRPVSRGSLQYYPPQPASAEAEQWGVAAHTDFGVLTVLCQDQVGGLELQLPDGQWAAVPPVEGTFVINVGDLLSRWTDGRFRSTPHRVMNRSGRERLSLVLAYDPNFDTWIEPAAFCEAGRTPRAEPISCGEYLLWRFEKAFSYRHQQ